MEVLPAAASITPETRPLFAVIYVAIIDLWSTSPARRAPCVIRALGSCALRDAM